MRIHTKRAGKLVWAKQSWTPDNELAQLATGNGQLLLLLLLLHTHQQHHITKHWVHFDAGANYLAIMWKWNLMLRGCCQLLVANWCCLSCCSRADVLLLFWLSSLIGCYSNLRLSLWVKFCERVSLAIGKNMCIFCSGWSQRHLSMSHCWLVATASSCHKYFRYSVAIYMNWSRTNCI